MSKYCQIVMGPAGSGKSTYCNVVQQHFENVGRSVHVVNLDPAAERFDYNCSLDISELITVDDVMGELEYGPNGGLIYCIEYLVNNLDWFSEKIGDYNEDYLIIDCPGQIELYTHSNTMKKIAHFLHYQLNYKVVCLYLIDVNFVNESSKFISGTLMSLSTMINFELPHINLLTKVDLLGEVDEEKMSRHYEVNTSSLISDLNENMPKRFHDLNAAIGAILDEYSLVNFFPLNINDEDSINNIMAQIDTATQYGEHEEPKDPGYYDVEDDHDSCQDRDLDALMAGDCIQNSVNSMESPD